MSRTCFSGVDFRTGRYLTPPLDDRELAEAILRETKRDWTEERELRWAKRRNFRNRGPDRRPAADVDPLRLASSGWGVIFPEDTPEDVRVALAPLVEHRRTQASEENGHYFRELKHMPGDNKKSFFDRYGVPTGPAHPKNLPYYLLIVGGPETVPYRFQYLLDMQYAVGRLHFDDAADYATYARSVVEAEAGRCAVRPEACFLPVANPGDDATAKARRQLVEPLREHLVKINSPWNVRTIHEGDKATLLRHLGGEETPAFLFTSSHGLGLDPDDDEQRDLQGALLCDTWVGDENALDLDDVVAARDLGSSARVHGMIAVFFACFGAGTPSRDNYPPIGWMQRRRMPEKAFVSRLAQRLLAHPNGGALAVVGHVDRAWSTSFGHGSGDGIRHFASFVQFLLEGFPVGAAMDWMNERFAELSTDLADAMDKYTERGLKDDEDASRLSSLWRANNDARNFVVLGDPAVYLPTGPRTARTPLGRALRVDKSHLAIPIASLWERHTEEWLKEVAGRSSVEADPVAILQALRAREEV